ncbi:MAG: TonB-dependent receptor [Sphingomonas sp.]|nr:TonB-dependent receptor [Sphingomonas sp.]MDX3884351.1 TonB-dependent receptor [Sphingomonas sp.]
MRKFLFSSSLLILAAAQAHAAPEAAPAPDAMGGDIIVTAQKREQRITDVPMSISAYGSGFLDQIGGTELSKISAITPGFVIQLQDKFAPGFSVRGITSNEFSPQAEQRVAVFQDGVAVVQTASAYGELFDIDRVEVEKGPQSTLHGRSALNGGVSIFQKRPTDDLSVELKAGGGNYDYYSLQGVVNLPVSDTLGIRFGALKRKRDGFVKDSDGSGTYNALDAQAYRFAGKWEPTSDFSFNLIATYDVDDTKGGVPFKSRTFLPLDQTTGAVVGDLRFWTPTHLDTFGTLPSPYFHREIVGISGTADWRLNDRLSLTSISGYRWFDACQSGDNDGTPTNLIAYHQCNDGKQYSEELRLNFKDVGIFEGFIGGSVFHANNGMSMEMGYDERAMALLLGGTLQNLAPRGLTNAEINALLGPAANVLKAFQLDQQITGAKITTYDIFADVTAHLTDRLELFAGARATWDKKDLTLQGLTPLGPSSLTGGGLLLQPTPGNAVLTGSNSSSNVTGRAGLRFKLTPDVNLYAVYGIGKRPEVLQLNPTTPAQLIPTETLKSAEAGVKFRLLGGRLVGDASVYHYEYENFQTLGLKDGIVATVNAGKADATGFEAQLSYELTPGISVFGSYGYNHARFRAGLYDGNMFRNSPDHKFAIGGNFEAPLKGGTVAFAPLYSWQSKMFFFEDNDRLDLQQRVPAAYSDRVVDEFQNGYGLLSARITFTPRDKKWSFALVGDNLTDKKFLVDAGNTGDYFGIPTFIAGSRRTYRAEFGVTF